MIEIKTDKMEEKLIEMEVQLNLIQDLLLQVLKRSDKDRKAFLSLMEAAEYLGISKNTIYTYTSKGVIPHYKMQNRRIYFEINDLDRFVLNKNNRIMSNEEIEIEAASRIVIKK